MITVGLTGSIGTGKSTVTKYLLERGYKVIDADKISRDVVKKGEIGYFKLLDYFGKEIIDKEENIDRQKLSKIVFSDKEKLEKLNSILHPVIIDKISELENVYKNKGEAIVFIDAPLLIETKLYENVDKVVLITADEDIQIKRIIKRDNIDETKARRIINAQMSFEEKRVFADFILKNNESRKKLFESLEIILQELVKV
ncbi:dephospho-CoA kinase [Acetoanaerobium pronyense]|uniref:Dephospho-CoA kinase n=1 Tax=Acetoanaerobium pronyense TaxID=1482736 RepID=A0ABS4KK21_9FIRM|nr:dephospho-CoA kinase [Acetoanaerobium pronyense]MBP2028118.1 dephospho-CoA kinase [Acetoanaerobium pronyense]